MRYNKDNWKGELEPFWPNDAIDKGIIVTVVLCLFFAVAFFWPGLFLPAEVPADPSNTPANIKPEWYFLAAYITLKLVPSDLFGEAAELIGMGIQMVAITGLMLLPFLDRSPERDFRKRPYFKVGVALGVLVFVGLTALGASNVNIGKFYAHIFGKG